MQIAGVDEATVEPQFKLGRHQPGGGIVEHRHPHVFHAEPGPSGTRFVIAPEDHVVELLISLVEALPGPYELFYELIDPFDEFLPGVYHWPGALSREEIGARLKGHQAFLEGDARHNVRIEATGSGSLIYDQHNFLYAIGDIERIGPVLANAGLKPGVATLPSPHSHHVRSEFGDAARIWLRLAEWVYFPFTEEETAVTEEESTVQGT